MQPRQRRGQRIQLIVELALDNMGQLGVAWQCQEPCLSLCKQISIQWQCSPVACCVTAAVLLQRVFVSSALSRAFVHQGIGRARRACCVYEMLLRWTGTRRMKSGRCRSTQQRGGMSRAAVQWEGLCGFWGREFARGRAALIQKGGRASNGEGERAGQRWLAQPAPHKGA